MPINMKEQRQILKWYNVEMKLFFTEPRSSKLKFLCGMIYIMNMKREVNTKRSKYIIINSNIDYRSNNRVFSWGDKQLEKLMAYQNPGVILTENGKFDREVTKLLDHENLLLTTWKNIG